MQARPTWIAGHTVLATDFRFNGTVNLRERTDVASLGATTFYIYLNQSDGWVVLDECRSGLFVFRGKSFTWANENVRQVSVGTIRWLLTVSTPWSVEFGKDNIVLFDLGLEVAVRQNENVAGCRIRRQTDE